jgi:hypothetical protein
MLAVRQLGRRSQNSTFGEACSRRLDARPSHPAAFGDAQERTFPFACFLSRMGGLAMVCIRTRLP